MTLLRLPLSDKLDSRSANNLFVFLIDNYYEVLEITGLNFSEMLFEKVSILWKPFVLQITEWVDRGVAWFSVKPLTPVQHSYISTIVVLFAGYLRSYFLDEVGERLVSIRTKQHFESFGRHSKFIII